jgi:CDP-glucose 4,6-dehydratase
MFNDIYDGKKVIVTGHTGFKGSWLSNWLIKLGANVVGISKDVPTAPSLFIESDLQSRIKHYEIDIRDLSGLSEVIMHEKPDFLFHLAAQAIVSTSYEDPINTITSNVVGTANVLESLKIYNQDCIAIIITSDKAYDNVEQVWGYREIDALGGKDVYSGSKGAAEQIIKSYYHSFFKLQSSKIRLAVARAGNVIGGGDWAKDRIVVDCMLSWDKRKSVKLRSPYSTRPWQHVLEPLSGYLTLALKLKEEEGLHGESFNFGPRSDQNRTVLDLIKDLSYYWNEDASIKMYEIVGKPIFHEANLLKLNCDKAIMLIDWTSTLNYQETVEFTSRWYYDYYHNRDNVEKLTLSQIERYESIAKKSGLQWTE